jgi:cation diffusion facilitator CzcD-associated flavoprotein CzcO
MANWLETYVEALELDVWLSSWVQKAVRDEKSGLWKVTVKRPEKSDREFEVKHVIFATGFGGVEQGNVPNIKGQEVFKGQVLHSLQHKTAQDHIGKKVVVVGACTSGALEWFSILEPK